MRAARFLQIGEVRPANCQIVLVVDLHELYQLETYYPVDFLSTCLQIDVVHFICFPCPLFAGRADVKISASIAVENSATTNTPQPGQINTSNPLGSGHYSDGGLVAFQPHGTAPCQVESQNNIPKVTCNGKSVGLSPSCPVQHAILQNNAGVVLHQELSAYGDAPDMRFQKSLSKHAWLHNTILSNCSPFFICAFDSGFGFRGSFGFGFRGSFAFGFRGSFACGFGRILLWLRLGFCFG